VQSNHSLSNERIVGAHFDGLKPPPSYEIEITSDSIEGLGVPRKSPRKQVLAGGLASQIANAIQQMQGRSAFAELTGSMDASHRKWTGIADTIQQMQGRSAFAELTGSMGASRRKWTGIADAIQQMQGRSAFAELTEAMNASRRKWTGVADTIQNFKLQQASTLAKFAEASEAATMRRSQLDQLVQSLALAHPELATVTAGGSPQSASQTPGVVSAPKWDDYIEYLVYYIPSVTKEWVRENPGAAISILIGLLTWLVPPPHQWSINKSENKNIRIKERRVVIAPNIEVRKMPSTASIITDTLYHNNTVEQVGEDGSWVKVEYRDKVEGEVRTGWVLRHYLN